MSSINQRPKSAILLSLPYNFQNKKQANQAKNKVKKTFLSFQAQQLLDLDVVQQKINRSTRSYVDNGPSLLNTTANHYSILQGSRSIKSLNNSRATSACKKKNIKLQGTTGLQNYSKLKPCKQISEKTLRNLEQCFSTANKQTNFINKVFATFVQNNSHKFKPKNSRFFEKNSQFQKQNILSVQGKCVSFSSQEKTLPKFTQQQSYFKTNCFQPVLKTKQNSKLMKKSRKYFQTKA